MYYQKGCILILLFFNVNSILHAQLSYQKILNALKVNSIQNPTEDKYVIEHWLKPALLFYKDYKNGVYKGYKKKEIERLWAKKVAKIKIVNDRIEDKDNRADRHHKKLNKFKKAYIDTKEYYTYHVVIIDIISFYGKEIGISNKYLGGRIPHRTYYQKHRISDSCFILRRIKQFWGNLKADGRSHLGLIGVNDGLIQQLTQDYCIK